jgi:hypothetical protein
MHSSEAYSVLSHELSNYSQQEYRVLADLVGQPPTRKELTLDGEIVTVEVCCRWQNESQRAIRIEAIALGPSCWRMERLEESIVVSAPWPR